MITISMFPWTFSKIANHSHVETHLYLVAASVLLSIITFISQRKSPAPYGKFSQLKNWGPPVAQRLAHSFNDGIYGSVLFAVVFLSFRTERSLINWTFFVCWELHFLHRGFIHPWLMNYSSSTVSLGIFFCGISLILYSYLNAEFIGSVVYEEDFLNDPRFATGLCLFIAGFTINRWADWKLVQLRSSRARRREYSTPYGGLYRWISCPNYFGEMIEWWGWALMTCSPAGLSYALFASATFIPRAAHTHAWYIQKFRAYPRDRRALVPGVY